MLDQSEGYQCRNYSRWTTGSTADKCGHFLQVLIRCVTRKIDDSAFGTAGMPHKRKVKRSCHQNAHRGLRQPWRRLKSTGETHEMSTSEDLWQQYLFGWRRLEALHAEDTQALDMAPSQHKRGHGQHFRSYPPFLLMPTEVCGCHSCGG